MIIEKYVIQLTPTRDPTTGMAGLMDSNRKKEFNKACRGLSLKLFSALKEKDKETVYEFIKKFKLQEYHELVFEAVSSGSLRLIKAVIRAGCKIPPVSVNLSLLQINHPKIPMYVFDQYLKLFKTDDLKRRAIQDVNCRSLPLGEILINRGDLQLIEFFETRGFEFERTAKETSALLERLDNTWYDINILEYFLKKGRLCATHALNCQLSERLLRELKLVQMLVKYGADPSFCLSCCVVSRFISSCPLDIIEYLVSCGARSSLSCIRTLAKTFDFKALGVVLPVLDSGIDRGDRKDKLGNVLKEVLEHVVSECQECIYAAEVPRNREEHVLAKGGMYEFYFPVEGIGKAWSSETTYGAMLVTSKLLVLHGASIPSRNNPLYYLLKDFRRKLEFSLVYNRLHQIDHPLMADRDLSYAVTLFV
jgi:hypothetical protein